MMARAADYGLARADEYGLWLAAVVGGLTALGWLGVRVRRGARAAHAFIHKVSTRLDQLDNNGGSSMKDLVERTALGLDSITTVMDGMSDTQDQQGLALEAQGTQIDELRGIVLAHLAAATPPTTPPTTTTTTTTETA